MTQNTCYSCLHLGVCHGEKVFNEHAWEASNAILMKTAHGFIPLTLQELQTTIVKAISQFCSAYLADYSQEPTDA